MRIQDSLQRRSVRQCIFQVAAVIERIRKLERNGIIRQYTVVADQHKIGNDVTALMEVSLEHPKYYDEFTKVMHDNPSIVACDYLTGDYDFNDVDPDKIFGDTGAASSDHQKH